jgi:hypothetical protein
MTTDPYLEGLMDALGENANPLAPRFICLNISGDSAAQRAEVVAKKLRDRGHKDVVAHGPVVTIGGSGLPRGYTRLLEETIGRAAIIPQKDLTPLTIAEERQVMSYLRRKAYLEVSLRDLVLWLWPTTTDGRPMIRAKLRIQTALALRVGGDRQGLTD